MPRRQRYAIGAMLVAVLVTACQETPVSPAAPEAAPAPAQSRAQYGEGYLVAGERRIGWVMGRDGNPMQVSYEVHEGLAIWEGDIVLGKATDIPASREALLRQPSRVTFPAIYINGSSYRWSGGVVPYVIDAGLPNQARMTDAMNYLTLVTAGITFVARTTESDYIHFVDATGCSSAVGRQGGVQTINFASGCSLGNAKHEILHALGLYHEQSRCDRDTYVEIHLENVEAGKEHNFDKVCDTDPGTTTDDGAYDEGSIMHYGPYFFSKNNERTIVSLRGREANMGQRDSLSSTDIGTINLLYGANNQAPTAAIGALAASYDEGSSVPFDGSGSSDPDDPTLTYAWSFGDGGTSTSAVAPHTYTDNGDFTATLTVSDGTLTDTRSVVVHVVNVAPSVNAGPDGQKNEGALFTQNGSFTDPGADVWTADVDYGDGSGVQPLALSGKNFSLSHTYADNGSYPITVWVSDDDGGLGSDVVVMTILNVVPSVNAGPDGTVVSGQNFTLAGSFSDPGIIDYPWNWTVNWGFGTNSTGSTNDQSLPISASTQACAAGTYSVVLSVTDKDNGTGSDNMQLLVSYFSVAIDITPISTPNPVSLKKNGLVPVAILSTATFDATQADPSRITLGDEIGTDTPVAMKKNGTSQASFEDVNSDGLLDLVLMFDNPTLVLNGDINGGTTQLVLRGFLNDGCTNFRGTDAVVVVP